MIFIVQYDYLKDSMVHNLLKKAHLKSLSHEYDLSTCTNVLVSQDLMIIHTSWTENYNALFKVIPSDQSAGNVGILCHKEHPQEVDLFLEFLKKHDD